MSSFDKVPTIYLFIFFFSPVIISYGFAPKSLLWVFRANAKILEQAEQYDMHADMSACAILLGYVLFSSCLDLLWIGVGCTSNP